MVGLTPHTAFLRAGAWVISAACRDGWATMASTQEKCDWLKEHLVYEYDMLRYSYLAQRWSGAGPWWNAHYECFAVHARLLREFLASDGGANNFDADDFVPDYKQKPEKELAERMREMNEQVFHAGKQRQHSHKKITSLDIQEMYGWLYGAMCDFTSKLGSPYRELWKPAAFPDRMDVPETHSTQSTSVETSNPVQIGSDWKPRG
jgi:hypothetical protein